MALGKFKLALKDFEAVKRAKPKDSDAITKYNECNKIVRQRAFAKAIAVETRSAVESVHYETLSKCDCSVTSFPGPRYFGVIT